jgi:hypothetical protein
VSTAFSVARDVFAGIGVAVTAALAVLFGVAVARDRKRRRLAREGDAI